MGVLEYRNMPTLSEAGHEGWCCTLTILQLLEITLPCSWAAAVRATGTVQKSQVVQAVQNVQNHT